MLCGPMWIPFEEGHVSHGFDFPSGDQNAPDDRRPHDQDVQAGQWHVPQPGEDRHEQQVGDQVDGKRQGHLPVDPATERLNEDEPEADEDERVEDHSVILLDQVTQLSQQRMPQVRTRPARRPRRFEPRGEDQQDLQVGQHDFTIGTPGLFCPDVVDQAGHFRPRPVVQHDHGDTVRVVEEDATATDLGMERLDAQKVGVELNDLGVDGDIGDEPDVLVRDKEQEGGRAERELRGVGPKRPGAGFDQVDGEVTRPASVPAPQ